LAVYRAYNEFWKLSTIRRRTMPKNIIPKTAIILIGLFIATIPYESVPALGEGEMAYSLWLPLIFNPDINPIHQGIATYYYATGEGACSFDASPNDMMVTAMNAEEYDNAAYCGAYLHVVGPKGEVTVRVVDLCPECKAGHLDLSQEAFAKIADLPQGRVNITWQLVSPTSTGPIAYHFKDGSNQWWTAVQIRNHRNPIAKFEYRTGGGHWLVVPRVSYNFFVQDVPDMGPGPYTFRVTDWYGNVLTDTGIPFIENGTVNGTGQFPPGP
jgi:expansin